MAEVNAYVTEENGQIVLHDPIAEGVVAAVEQHNRGLAYESCQNIYEQNQERIQHFRRRFIEKGYQPTTHCIVVIQVDDPYGGVISEKLMPGYDWRPIREEGLMPFARGIADRSFIREAIAIFDEKAATDLDLASDSIAVVVVAHSVAKVFTP